jgi:hypothetical protein
MASWLSDASANRHIKTYVKDFLDVSGNMTVRNGDLGISGGKLGVGTDSPSRDLSIYKDSYPSFQIANSSTGAGPGYGFEIQQGGNSTEMINRADGNMTFWTNSTSRMRICNDGNVSIGTNTSYYPLYVATYKAFNDGDIRYFRRNSSLIYSSNAVNMGNTSIIANGSIGSANGNFFSYSDRRIKQDIVEINDDSALQQLRALNPCRYKYKDPIARNEYNLVEGFIAQEVAEVIPGAVKIEPGDIPNVMLMGSCSGDIITIPNFDTSTLELDASGNIFPKLKLTIDDKDKEVYVNIQEVVSSTELRVEIIGDDITELPSEIFIYGQYADDKLTLVKDKIFTVGISALQEVDKQQQADKARIATLETQLADVLARLSALESR